MKTALYIFWLGVRVIAWKAFKVLVTVVAVVAAGWLVFKFWYVVAVVVFIVGVFLVGTHEYDRQAEILHASRPPKVHL